MDRPAIFTLEKRRGTSEGEVHHVTPCREKQGGSGGRRSERQTWARAFVMVFK